MFLFFFGKKLLILWGAVSSKIFLRYLFGVRVEISFCVLICCLIYLCFLWDLLLCLSFWSSYLGQFFVHAWWSLPFIFMHQRTGWFTQLAVFSVIVCRSNRLPGRAHWKLGLACSLPSHLLTFCLRRPLILSLYWILSPRQLAHLTISTSPHLAWASWGQLFKGFSSAEANSQGYLGTKLSHFPGTW